MQVFDPYEAMLIGSGYALDAVGSIQGIDLPRLGAEPDDIYRTRLISKWVAFLTPVAATGEYLDQWTANTVSGGDPEEAPRDTSVRDAVRNNW